jgi:CARDB protein
MLRGFATVAALAAVGSAGSGQPVAGPGPAQPYVRVLSCSPASGSAVFYGRMHSQGAGQRMSMRFALLERRGSGPFQPVRAPRLDRWRRSRPGVAMFGYRQRVRGLSEDGVYRARVDFRWHDRDGELVRRARRRSRTCSQAGPLPNLRVQITRVRVTTVRGVFRYLVRVTNAGAAEAEEVDVRLDVDGSAVDTETVPHLQAGESTVVDFRGPGCGSSVKSTADPDATVRESSESDNSHSLSCSELPR